MSNEKYLGSILLYCGQGASDKEYKFELHQSPTGTYELIAKYGRRGRLSNTTDLGVFNNTIEAMVDLRKSIAAKLKKGYAITHVHDRPFLLGGLDEAMILFARGIDAFRELGVAPPALQIKAVEVVVTVNEGQFAPIW
jgi:hypothetical protein